METNRTVKQRIQTDTPAEEFYEKKVAVITYIPLVDNPYIKTYEMTIGELKAFTDDLGECGECIIQVDNKSMPLEWALR